MEFPTENHLEKCQKCGKKILVMVALCGVSHNVGVYVSCAECLTIDEKYKERHPEEVKRIEEWLTGST